MSGDVQPRKRKDKKRKKDELGVEEPRGTAAVFGEGDVFMHSPNEHGTGGHWCAKVIFFSLLTILITLIGLIILENRGITDLEANSVESRYSGVLEGWLEEAPDDDHHDEHTLELKHHDEEEHEDEPKDVEIEVEKIEKEVSEEDDVSSESPSYVHIGEVDGESQEDEKDADADVEEEEFLEPEDEELPVAERITVPAGKPLKEMEDETSSERPPDTLADEEEYEKQQEELRREQEQASHLWLKLAVGGALLAATHAVVRRATTPRAADTGDEHASREETPSIIDRRMTLIMEEPPAPVVPKSVPRDAPKPIEREVVKKTPTIVKAPPPKQESEEEEEEVEIQIISKAKKIVEALKDKELYSDEEDEEEEIVEKEEIPKKSEPVKEKEPTPEPDEPEDDDVEIIDDEQLEEELEEEDVEEEISDVDDAELLTRLEAKYGRLPEPERPERKHKDGGNSIEDDWPGEPSDPYWREQLDRAEEELRQEWLD